MLSFLLRNNKNMCIAFAIFFFFNIYQRKADNMNYIIIKNNIDYILKYFEELSSKLYFWNDWKLHDKIHYIDL